MIVLDTPEGIAFYQLCALRGALKLEVLGMRSSRGSAGAVARRVLNTKERSKRVLLGMVEDEISHRRPAIQDFLKETT